MKKHRLIFAMITIVTLITIACNVLFTAPATPQDPQPPQQPGQPRQQPGQPIPQPGQPGQQPGGSGPIIDQMVTIPGNGGNAEVAFNISDGQRVHIQLSAANQGIQPYGSLQYPDGATVDSPPLNTTTNGTNQADVLLNQIGRYTLTLFDGSNQGGAVSVKIIILK